MNTNLFVYNCNTKQFVYVLVQIRTPIMMKKKLKPTESELEILQVLWQHGPSTVRFVNETLSRNKPIGYTTTLKLMQLMVEKGIAQRDTSSRTHVYSSKIKQTDTQKSLLTEFIGNAFGGSVGSLVLQVLGHHSPTSEELIEIKALIERIETEKL